MSKHTPGPWVASHIGSDFFNIAGDTSGDSVEVGRVTSSACDGRASRANARLIAAAPDLLAELKHLVSLMEPLEQSGGLNIPGLATLNGARAAIQKAEGKS